jgi:hypothetical protein
VYQANLPDENRNHVGDHTIDNKFQKGLGNDLLSFSGMYSNHLIDLYPPIESAFLHAEVSGLTILRCISLVYPFDLSLASVRTCYALV